MIDLSVSHSLHGDCLKLMDLIPSESIPVILCDLPYGTTRNKWDSIIPLAELWQHYKRIIKPNGVILLTAQTPFDKVLGASNLPMLKYEWIWEKTTATGHLNAKKMPMKAHENVLVFYKKPPVYNPQKTDGHERKVSTAKHKRNSAKTTNYGDHGLTSYDSTERYPRSVQVFPTDKQKSAIHPTQKPLALFEYFILTYSNEGDVILDNCAGSFTTAEACLNTNRKYLCIEKEQEYYDKGTARIAQWHNNKDLKITNTQPSLF